VLVELGDGVRARAGRAVTIAIRAGQHCYEP
jgi:hypothetical protein